MIGYTTLGTNNFEKAVDFYDQIAKIMGAGRTMESETFCSWGGMGTTQGSSLSVIKPFNGEAATVGNGTMPAIHVKDQEQVAQIHTKALELGGTSEGEPGFRGDGFYAAYFRDLDGNKLCTFAMVSAE